MSHSYPLRPLAKVIGNGLVSDGDWIESKDQDANGDVRLIQLADIGDGRYLNKSNRFLTKETASRLKCTPLLTGDVLIARMPDPIGRACIFPGDAKEAITVVDVCILRVDQLATDAAWLMNVINADVTRSAIEKAAGGTTRTRVSRGSLEKLLLPTPSLQEQHKIAAILTAVDDKLDVIARQIEATQTLKQGLMQTLFSRGIGTQDADGRWIPHAEFKDSELGGIPQSWTVSRLQDVSEFITKGGTPTTYGFDWANAEEGIPFFRSECVTNQGFNPKGMNFIQHDAHRVMARSEVRPGDVLMTITGNIGRVARVPIKYATANINQHIARIRLGNGNAEFFYQCLQQEHYSKHYGAILTGQAYPQISLKQVRETPIVFPPLFEQRRIALILADADAKASLLSQRLLAYQALKRGLMQKLLTGEWRVKVDAEMAA